MRLNRCEFIGRPTQDIHAQQGRGAIVARFALAVERAGRKGGSGAEESAADLVPCVAFGQLAELLASRPRRGEALFVVGRFSARQVTDPADAARKTTSYSVVVEEVQFLSAGRPTTAPAQKPRPITNAQEAADSVATAPQDGAIEF